MEGEVVNNIPLDEQEPESLKLDEVQDETSAETKLAPEPLVKAHKDLVCRANLMTQY